MEAINLEAIASIQSELDNLEQQKAAEESKLSDTMDNLASVEKEVSKLTKAAKKFKADSVGIKTLIEKFPNAVNYDMIAEALSILENALGEGVCGRSLFKCGNCRFSERWKNGYEFRKVAI